MGRTAGARDPHEIDLATAHEQRFPTWHGGDGIAPNRERRPAHVSEGRAAAAAGG